MQREYSQGRSVNLAQRWQSLAGLGLEMLQQIVATVGAQLVVRLQAEPVKRRGENAENEVSRDAKILEGEKKSSRSSQMQRSVLARCGPLARALARHKRGADGQPIVNPEVPGVKNVVLT